LTPAIVAACIAVVGQAHILFNDFGAGNYSQNSVSARMITAAAVSRAGAIEILPKRAAGRPAS
jgi:ABC-type transport system involved in Fe-S cluster assembly fused permease/ATPase subunit